MEGFCTATVGTKHAAVDACASLVEIDLIIKSCAI